MCHYACDSEKSVSDYYAYDSVGKFVNIVCFRLYFLYSLEKMDSQNGGYDMRLSMQFPDY